ncbi:hypothetical protein ACET3Z_008365 [Daucus carota]
MHLSHIHCIPAVFPIKIPEPQKLIIIWQLDIISDPRWHNFRPQQVLIDKSMQSTEPECLIPLILGVKLFLLVTVANLVLCHYVQKAAHSGLAQSLFERLV